LTIGSKQSLEKARVEMPKRSGYTHKDIKKISLGGAGGHNDHYTVLFKDGCLYSAACAGSYCSSGQLGRTGEQKELMIVDTDVVDVFTGGWHTHYIKRDGSLYAFGFSGDGRCGVGHKEPCESPTEVIEMCGQTVMIGNGCFSALLDKRGHVYGAGGEYLKHAVYTPILHQEGVFIEKIVAGVYSTLMLSRKIHASN
jgi:alpha-tubulin suppressor-like RCC1 family protein